MARAFSEATALLILGMLGLAWPIEAQDVTDAPESVLFEPLPVVEAATLHSQAQEEAPASVTVISAEEIRTYGWRTLGEVLGAVRGFYMTYDRAYQYAGISGLSLPGDYTTRMLVMLNGHYLTDNVYSSNGFFGQDFPLDMDMVKRIEIVRGPSSALYGSNGVLATINIVTKSPAEMKTLRASTETGSFGEKKLELSSGASLAGGASLLVSGSAFHNTGQSLYFPNLGGAPSADGEKGYHAFVSMVLGKWTFTGLLGSREKQVPTGWFGTILGDPGNRITDSRGFLEAAYTREMSASRRLRWRLYYDQYRYRARYDYALDRGVEDDRDRTRGDWAGSELDYDVAVPNVGVLTVGGEVNVDIRARQEYYEQTPVRTEILNVNRPNAECGLFAQQQWQIARDWTAFLGVRFDDSRLYANFISPRAALVYRRSPRTTYKLLYGRAFRNPNVYEAFYDDGSTLAGNPSLRAERADTYEVDVEHKFGARWSGVLNAYDYQLHKMIDAVPLAGGLFQYQNADQGHANGVGGEFSGRPIDRIEATGSLTWTHTEIDGEPRLANSPNYLAKWRAAMPVWRNKVWAAGSIQYTSPRRTLGGETVPAVWLTDLTFTTRKLHPDFDIQFGVRNLFNRTYYDPAGTSLPEQVLRQNGRSLFLKLIMRTKE